MLNQKRRISHRKLLHLQMALSMIILYTDLAPQDLCFLLELWDSTVQISQQEPIATPSNSISNP